MQLRDLGDWCALLDALKERGATHVKVATSPAATNTPDGNPYNSVYLTALEFSARPIVEPPAPPKRRSQEDADRPERKPEPAGMGYR